MKLIKLLSLFLVSLVLSMPICFAATFTAYSQGTDGVRNFVRPTDEIKLIAEVQGTDVYPEDVLYVPLTGSQQSFDNCNEGICVYTLDEDTYEGVQRFTVRYKSRSGTEDRIVNTLVDSIGASVDSVTKDKQVVGPNELITFNFEVSDTACNDILCNNKCSGISKIVISKEDLDDEISEIVVGTDFDECAESVEKSYIVSELGLEEGQNALFFQAYDNFGTVGDFQTMSLILDSTPPSLQDETFYLTKNGEGIGYYNYQVPGVEVLFYLDDTNVSSVKANLQELNPALGNVNMECEEILCKKVIDLNPTLTKDKGSLKLTIPVEVADKFGNSETYDLTSELEIDRVGPEIKEVESTSDYKDSKIVGISSKTQLKAIVDEEGSGMSNGEIYIDYSAVGGPVSVKAINCTGDWECLFPKVNLTKDGVNTLKVLTTTKDDLGNAMLEAYSFEVYSDNTNPTIKDIYVYFEKTDQEFPTRGDKLTVMAVINDSSEVIGKGNFTLINGEGMIETKCKSGKGGSSGRGTFTRGTTGGRETTGSSSSGLSSGSFERGSPTNETNTTFQTSEFTEEIDTSGYIVCEWEVPVTVSGTVVNGQIGLNFIDEFNNSISEIVEVPLIYGLFEEENPNYWEAGKVSCSPSVLDREIGELIEQEMYCNFELTPLTDSEQRITSMELSDCESDYLSDSSLSNVGTNPYLTLIFDEDEYEVNNLEVLCNVEIMSIVGTNIVTNTELENVTIPVEFFNNPFGMPDQNLIDEIEDIRETWAEGFGEIIYWLELLEKIATEVCKTINTVQQIETVLTSATAALPDFYGGMAARAAKEPGNVASEGLFGSLDHFCKFVNCEFSSEDEGILANLGGGGLLAGVTENVQYFAGGQLVDALGGDYKQYMNVKNNIYLSAMTLCIPGIIHGLAKYRQIQCFYGYCLQDMSVMGVPYESCEEQKAYQECKYFVTPIFTFFPIVNLFDDVMNSVKGALSDPFVAIGLVMNWACTDYSQVGWGVCRIARVINVATKAYNNVVSILNLIDEFDHDYCEDLEESPRSSPGGSSRGGGFSR